jgi:hypothetical protein
MKLKVLKTVLLIVVLVYAQKSFSNSNPNKAIDDLLIQSGLQKYVR